MAQNERVFEGRTDKEGKLVVTHLKAGKYSYRESKAPSRYALDTTAYTFEVDETGGVTGDLAVSDPFTGDTAPTIRKVTICLPDWNPCLVFSDAFFEGAFVPQ